MLTSLKESSPRVPARAALILACLAVGGLAIPTLKWVTAGPFAGQSKPTAAGPLVVLFDDEPVADAADAGRATKGEPEPAEEFFPKPAAGEQKILEALEKPVNVDFTELPLEDCITMLQEMANVDILLDHVKLTEEGVALDQPITLRRLKGRRLESVLNLLLRPVQLDYVIEDDVLKITTGASAADTLLTRTYPVGDLCPELKEREEKPAEKSGRKSARVEHFDAKVQFALFQGFGGGRPSVSKEDSPKNGDLPEDTAGGGRGGVSRGQQPRPRVTRFTNLMNALTGTIQPDSWEELSGPGSMYSVNESSCLVIRQTRSVHREIVQLLRDLRAAKRLQRVPPRRAVRDVEADEMPGARGGGFF